MQPQFKKDFIERYKKLTDWKEFKEACVKRLKRSIRVNTLKISQEELAKRALQSKIKTIQDHKKLMNFLLRRGFDASTARHAVDESLGKR